MVAATAQRLLRREEVLNLLREHQDQLRTGFGVHSLALFGSLSRDEACPGSDVDLLVEFDRPIGLLHLVGTAQHLERLLGVERVDLVLRRAVLPALQARIFAEAVDVFPARDMEVARRAHA